MVQIQVQVPSIATESTVTANLEHKEDLKLELESEIKIMDTSSEQKVKMKYGNVIVHLAFLLMSTFQFG